MSQHSQTIADRIFIYGSANTAKSVMRTADDEGATSSYGNADRTNLVLETE